MNAPAHFKNIARKNMVVTYDITPIRRFQCLPKRPIQGLYKEITDEAYQFTAQLKSSSNSPFVFYTGANAGGDLLKLLKAALPPLETWESKIGQPHSKNGVAGGGVAVGGVNDFNARLLRLLNLFFLQYPFDPSKPSAKIFDQINRNLGTAQLDCAKKVNTILVNMGTTSTKLVYWLTAQIGGATIRPYDFTVINDYLSNLPQPPATIAICKPF